MVFFSVLGPLGFHNNGDDVDYDDSVLNVIQTASLRKLNGSSVGKAPNLKSRETILFFPLCTRFVFGNLCLFLKRSYEVHTFVLTKTEFLTIGKPKT